MPLDAWLVEILNHVVSGSGRLDARDIDIRMSNPVGPRGQNILEGLRSLSVLGLVRVAREVRTGGEWEATDKGAALVEAEWAFDVTEVSAGVYHVKGRDKAGRCVEVTGTDPHDVLARGWGMARKVTSTDS